MTNRLRHTALCVLLAACAPQVLGASTVGTPSTSGRQSYRARVESIARDLLWSNALLLNSQERYEEARSSIDKPRRNTDAGALAGEADAAKTALLTNIKIVRLNALRLRAISPVPRAWKRLDDGLVESAWEWNSALDIMDLWLQHPSDALKNETAKHTRRALTLLDASRRRLWILSDPNIMGKSYRD